MKVTFQVILKRLPTKDKICKGKFSRNFYSRSLILTFNTFYFFPPTCSQRCLSFVQSLLPRFVNSYLLLLYEGRSWIVRSKERKKRMFLDPRTRKRIYLCPQLTRYPPQYRQSSSTRESLHWAISSRARALIFPLLLSRNIIIPTKRILRTLRNISRSRTLQNSLFLSWKKKGLYSRNKSRKTRIDEEETRRKVRFPPNRNRHLWHRSIAPT